MRGAWPSTSQAGLGLVVRGPAEPAVDRGVGMDLDGDTALVVAKCGRDGLADRQSVVVDGDGQGWIGVRRPRIAVGNDERQGAAFAAGADESCRGSAGFADILAGVDLVDQCRPSAECFELGLVWAGAA